MTITVCTDIVQFYDLDFKFIGSYLLPHSAKAEAISWNCTGNKLLLLDSLGQAMILRPYEGKSSEISRITVAKNDICAGSFSKVDPDFLALGTTAGNVSLFGMVDKKVIRYKQLPTKVHNVDLNCTNESLIASTHDGHIFLYTSSRNPIASFIIPKSFTLSKALFSPYNSSLAGASLQGRLAVWNAETKSEEFCCKPHKSHVTDVAFLENTLTTVGTDGCICLFDLRTHSRTAKNNLEGALSSLAYVPSSSEIVVGSYQQLRKYDFRKLSLPVNEVTVQGEGHIKMVQVSGLPMKALSGYKIFTKRVSSPIKQPTPPSANLINFEMLMGNHMDRMTKTLQDKIDKSFSQLTLLIRGSFTNLTREIYQSWTNSHVGFYEGNLPRKRITYKQNTFIKNKES